MEPFISVHDVVSFDFFDTVAHRSCSLQNIMHKTAEYGAATIAGDTMNIGEWVFLAARGAHADSVKAKGRERNRNEIELTDVFERALKPYFSSCQRRLAAAKKLVDFEIGLEKEVLSVDPDFLELVATARRAGKKIILISDMYLPQEGMEKILRHLGIREYFDHVFISANVGVTKHSGLLFDHVARVLGVEPRRCLHVGDNYNNDSVQPRERGWSALHYFNPTYERKRRQFGQRDAALLSNKSRARSALHAITRSSATSSLDNVINSVIAPAFLAFAIRALQYAERNRLDRLYFLTRDGVLFERIARLVEQHMPILSDAEDRMRILSINRNSAMLLRYRNFYHLGWAEHAVRWMSNRELTLRNLLDTFELSVADLPGLSEQVREIVEQNLDLTGFHPVTDFLMSNTRTRHSFEKLFRQERDKVVAYLRQEGVLENRNIGVVDIGYSGTIVKFLSSYLMDPVHMDEYADNRIHCQFFATNRFYRGNIREMHPGVIFNPGVMVRHDVEEDKPLIMNFGWLEPFALEPDLGRLKGYRRGANGKIEPVLADPRNPEARQQIRQKVLDRCTELIRDLVSHPVRFDEFEATARDRLREFVTKPSWREVSAMRQIVHDFGIATSTERTVVRLMTPFDLVSLRKHMRNDVWIHGSLKGSMLGFATPLANRLAHRIS